MRRAKIKNATISLRLPEGLIDEYTLVAKGLGFSRNQLMEKAFEFFRKKGVLEYQGQKLKWPDVVALLDTDKEK